MSCCQSAGLPQGWPPLGGQEWAGEGGTGSHSGACIAASLTCQPSQPLTATAAPLLPCVLAADAAKSAVECETGVAAAAATTAAAAVAEVEEAEAAVDGMDEDEAAEILSAMLGLAPPSERKKGKKKVGVVFIVECVCVCAAALLHCCRRTALGHGCMSLQGAHPRLGICGSLVCALCFAP